MAIIDDICQYYKQQGSIQGTAQLAGISDQKARKLLITAGAIQPGKVAGGAAAPFTRIEEKRGCQETGDIG
ncbi:MAG TPA: hypothetical protein DEB10_14840 [Ruminococcaceae bacterium]|jgi:hypothetical protein|nr:hypothetical protein [Oscillospiraceae bacterium]